MGGHTPATVVSTPEIHTANGQQQISEGMDNRTAAKQERAVSSMQLAPGPASRLGK